MNNEITVKINCSVEKLCDILQSKGFLLIDKYRLEDIYYIEKDIDVIEENFKKILERNVLIRKVIQFIPENFSKSYNIIKLIAKQKKLASDGTITFQEKSDCQIKDAEQGKEFLKSINYKELITIKEDTKVYSKGKLKLAIKDIINGENLIEVETIENDLEFDTIDKLKQKINELQIPINTNDYFVKKVEIELKKFFKG